MIDRESLQIGLRWAEPYFRVWIMPRAAMRSYLQCPARAPSWAIILVAGLVQLAIEAATESELPLRMLLLGLLTVVMDGVFLYFVLAAILAYACRAWGGSGGVKETRAVLAWREYVATGTMLLMSLIIWSTISELPEPAPFQTEFSGPEAIFRGLGRALLIYEWVITAILFAEAHQLARYKGLLLGLLTSALFGIYFVVTFAVSTMVM